MRILQVIPFFYPCTEFGGPVTVAYNISKALAERGHEVFVYTTDASRRRRSQIVGINSNVDGFKAYYFKNAFKLDGLFVSPGMIPVVKKQIKGFDITHLHLFYTFQNIVAYRYLKKWRKPYVLSAHGSVLPIIEKIILKKLFHKTFGFRILNAASRLIAVSSMEKKQYTRAGVPYDKISVIPNGIDIDSFKRLPSSGIFRERYKISEPNIILYLGRIHKRKGIDFILKAFSKLQSSDSILVISGPDAGYMSTAKKMAYKLGINEKVIFTGFLTEEEKLAAYVDSTVVVSPGIFEIFGLVPLEAALCRKPVIVSSDCGIAEMVQKRDFGFLVDPGDVVSLRDYLMRLVVDNGLADRMGSNGKDFVTNYMSWQNVVPRLEELYFQAAQNARNLEKSMFERTFFNS